jgi:hypothetical protein
MNNQDIDKVILDADQLLKSKETLFQNIDQKLNSINYLVTKAIL